MRSGELQKEDPRASRRSDSGDLPGNRTAKFPAGSPSPSKTVMLRAMMDRSNGPRSPTGRVVHT